MKVLVTGHKGYIGAHLVDLLKQGGHTVTGCDVGLFEAMSKQGIKPNVITYSATIGAGRFGRQWQRAVGLVKKMR